MGVFSRFKDIVSSNINAMLDKAEDPEKMIRLMIQEMEETLVELKASCASTMADKKGVERDIAILEKNIEKWQERAELAVDKGRDDLAKEALIEKNRYAQQIDSASDNITRFDLLIENARKDIDQLEEKITAAKEKQKVLIKRQIRAGQSLKAQKEIKNATSNDVFRRFEAYEHRIDRMEAEASMVQPTPGTLEDEFTRLENNGTVDDELAALKKKKAVKE